MLSRRSLLLAATASILVALNDDGGLALAFAPPAAPPSANNANGIRAAHASSASSMATMMAASPPPDANNDNRDDDDDNNHGLASRRNFLADILPRMAAGSATLAALACASADDAAVALDFDAFERGEIASDTAKCDPKRDPKCIPKLSSDEALCQYGGGGSARGEACMRVRAAGGKLPPTVKKEKSLGGAYAM